MYLYKIVIEGTDQVYIGITNNVKRRETTHRYKANSGHRTRLYDTIRKYQNFEFIVIGTYATRDEACQAEKDAISLAHESGIRLMNLTAGGDGGFVIKHEDKEVWREKLRKARIGRKPAQGMKHTDENKKLFSEVSRKYYEEKGTYYHNIEEIVALSHKEAKEVFGVSTTHYYRLRKRYNDKNYINPYRKKLDNPHHIL